MAKFNVLQYNKRQLALLGISSRQNETMIQSQRIQIVFIYLVLFAQVCIIIQCISRLCDSSIEFVNKIDKFQVIISVVQAMGVHLSMRFNVQNITSLNARLQIFVDAEGLPHAIHYFQFA